MIERKDLFTIPFYKKTNFTGSYLGMRYRIERAERSAPQDEASDNEPETVTVLKATVFPGPYCYDVVPEEKKTTMEFSFSEEGIADACKWLNEQYEAAPEKWAQGHI